LTQPSLSDTPAPTPPMILPCERQKQVQNGCEKGPNPMPEAFTGAVAAHSAYFRIVSSSQAPRAYHHTTPPWSREEPSSHSMRATMPIRAVRSHRARCRRTVKGSRVNPTPHVRSQVCADAARCALAPRLLSCRLLTSDTAKGHSLVEGRPAPGIVLADHPGSHVARGV